MLIDKELLDKLTAQTVQHLNTNPHEVLSRYIKDLDLDSETWNTEPVAPLS